MPKLKQPKRGRVRFQDWIVRADLQKHPKRAYLFGDNMLKQGRGPGSGQAEHFRDEPNAISVYTKRKPMRTPDAYMSGTPTDLYYLMASLADVARIRAEGSKVVIPTAGVGTGKAELRQRAPLLNALIEAFLAALVDTNNHEDPHVYRSYS